MHPLHNLSENELEDYDRALRDAARRASGCAHLADEVTQEVWLETLRRPPVKVENLGAWLRVAANRVAWRLRRRNENRRHRESGVARPETSWSFQEELEASIAKARLRSAIDSLREPYREMFTLHLNEGLTGPEIADRLRCPQNTVRSRLRRGRQELRAVLIRRNQAEENGSVARQFMGAIALLLGRPVKDGTTLAVAAAFSASVILGAFFVLNFHAPTKGVPLRVAEKASSVEKPTPPSADAIALRLGDERASVVPAGPAAMSEVSSEPAHSNAPPPQLDILGRVFSPVGPFAKAEIWATSDLTTGERRLIGHADEEGRYAISAGPLDWIWADAWGIAGSRPLRVDSLSRLKRGSTRLTLGRKVGTLNVVVLSPQGAPVAQAEVTLLGTVPEEPAWSTDGTLQGHRLSGLGVTGPDGVAVLEQPARKVCSVLIEAPGYSAEVQQHTFVDRYLDGTLELSLPWPAQASGRVFDQEGRPLPRATVLARSGGYFPEVEVECDDLGRYEFAALPPRPVELFVKPVGFDAPGISVASAELHSGMNVHDLHLRPVDSIEGIVTRGGLPVAGARIEVWSGALVRAPAQEALFSGPDGKFHLTRGTEQLYLLAYPPGKTSGFPMATTLVGDGDGRIELLAPRELGRVSGRLDMGQWRPGTRFEMSADSLPAPIPLAVDASGSLELTGLLADAYVLRAIVPSLGPQIIARIDLAPGESLQLGHLDGAQPGAVTLAVRTPDGSDVRFRTSTLVGQDVVLRHESTTGPTRTVVEANRLLFPLVPVGEYIGTLRTAGWATAVFSVEVTEGGSHEVFLDLEPGAPATVRIKQDQSGSDNVQVHLTHTYGQAQQDLSHLLHKRETGWGFAMNWPHGKHSLDARTNTGQQARVEFTIGPGGLATPVLLEL